MKGGYNMKEIMGNRYNKAITCLLMLKEEWINIW